MKIEIWLSRATRQLTQAGVSTARLDALVLLEDAVRRDRAWLLAHPEHELTPAQTTKLTKLLKRRARHEPLAYVRGKTEFYGRKFVLTPAVLEPRPESETMIDLFKTLPLSSQKVRVADVGTGSGALGITAALEMPQATVDLLDIDSKALQIAKINVDKLTPGLKIQLGDLLDGNSEGYNVLLCNLPYVPDDYRINLAAAHEPPGAIFGGPDGLDLYRRLFRQLTKRPKQPLFILTEALPPQHPGLAQIALRADYKLRQKDDFIQVFECIQK